MSSRFAERFSTSITEANSRGRVAVIPDIKCISPKEGDLLRGRDPVDIAKLLVCCGAPALSVVTEREHFGGGPDLLRAVADATSVPILRKDFIKDESALEETVEMGASAILLICSVMDRKTLSKLYESAIRLGLEPLVEVCTEEELKFACELGAQLIGINNRDIATLELDNGGPSRTAALACAVPKGALFISESGILTPDDARLAACAGANAVLVGTALLRADNIAAMYQSLQVERGRDSCALS